MNTGKRVRLNRIFSHPSGRICTVAIDHLIGLRGRLPQGLRPVTATLAQIVAATPDAVTMHKGIAASAWGEHAGVVPLIIQSTFARVDEMVPEVVATAEEVIRLGADAIAVAAFISGNSEAGRLRIVADCVRDAARFDLPVICHIYPRDLASTPVVSLEPDDVAWAVRCAAEMGADVVKAPFCGDIACQRQIVSDCPVPLVAAGGPRTATLEDALGLMASAVESGVRGATIGRNVWGHAQISAVVRAFKAVIHDRTSAGEALRLAGLDAR